MKKNIAIIHYNTPELTSALVQSVRLHTPGCSITVFDNSDARPFPAMRGVRVLDNTQGQIIDFKAVLSRYPGKRRTINDHASSKHILSVDYLFDILTEGFVLLDSDILIRKDISSFFDTSVPWVGSIEQPKPSESYKTVRLAPYLLWLNVPMLREHGIRFASEGRNYKMSHRGQPPYYDTGASVFEDCNNAGLRGRTEDIFDYMEHFAGGSYGKTQEEAARWLDTHKDLYQQNMAKKAQRTPKEELLVVIPYLMEGAQGSELKLAVKGWRRYYQGPMHIVVVGEGVSSLAADTFFTGKDITLLDKERVPDVSGYYRSHLDYVSCFRAVRELYPESKQFVMVADDCFAIKPFDMSDLQRLCINAESFDGDAESRNGWLRDKARTRALLDQEGLPHRNFTTHLPYLFEWDKWEAVVTKYGMDKQSYVIEDVYYNTYFPEAEAVLLDHGTDALRCWMSHGAIPPEDVYKAINGRKKWVCCSVAAYTYIVEDILTRFYGLQ